MNEAYNHKRYTEFLKALYGPADFDSSVKDEEIPNIFDTDRTIDDDTYYSKVSKHLDENNIRSGLRAPLSDNVIQVNFGRRKDD